MTRRLSSDIWLGFRRAVTANLSTSLVAALMFLLLGIMILLLENVRRHDRDARESIGLELYLRQDAAVSELQKLGLRLQQLDNLRSLKYQDKAEAYRELSNLLGDELLPAGESNPLPNSLAIRFAAPAVTLSNFQRLATELEEVRCVDQVFYNREWLQSQEPILDFVDALSTFLALLMFAATVIVIVWSVDRTMSTRRHEIAVLKSVGAGWRHIGLPILSEAVAVGLLGSASGLLLLYLIWSLARDLPLKLHFMSTYSATAVAVLGVFSGLTAAYVAVRRRLR